MLKNKLSNSLLSCLAVVALSGCESLHYSNVNIKDHNIFSTNAGTAQSQMDASNMTSMPGASSVVGGSAGGMQLSNADEQSSPSVEIYDMELNPEYNRGAQAGMSPMMNQSPMQPQMQMGQGYGGFMPASDSSVTIFNLDGGAPMNAPQYNAGQVGYTQNAYGNNQVAGQIFFKHGSSRLGSGDMRKISNLAEQAKFAPVNYVTVEGFASRPTNAGSHSTQAHIINLRQSMKRSEKVSKALVHKGVPGEKIKTVSWGSSKATGDNARDRRVDVVMGER